MSTYAPINVKPGGEAGHRAVIWKIVVKFPTPGQKCEVKFNWNSHPGKWFVVTGKKVKYPYPRDSKIIQMPYPRAKAINQIPALCPAFPPSPRRLDIDRCTRITRLRQTRSFFYVTLRHNCSIENARNLLEGKVVNTSYARWGWNFGGFLVLFF